ncbi:MAG TPA: LLM class F420-dependent oxidoreductase [Candidatus Limnocylindrales bacterium]|nr:LLM class F420-dependent oxidoreductase [Candidatus Limnocylindrales bacterium]
MRPIRIAAQLHPQHGDYPAIRDAAIRAEVLGYDLVYNWDHFFPLDGDPDGPHLECWTVLAAWAEATSRVEIGPLVSCTSYRNPHLLADMARTVDRISGGRLVLGLGAGWNRRDYEEYGFEYGTFGTRIAHLGESIRALQQRLDRLNPPPVRRPPLLIAGVGERRTLRLVAEHADGWHAFFPDRPAELEPKVAALLRWCGMVGRDPTEIEWGVGVQPDDLERFLAEDAETYVGMGFSQFTLGFGGPDWPVEAGRAWLAWRDACNRSRSAAATSAR